MVKHDHRAAVKHFRHDLEKQDLIHPGDTIGTDDETLLRFLRARQFNLKNATLMWKNCQQWRKTLEGVGIDELYRQIDPFDYPERAHVFENWPLYFHKLDKKGRPLNFHHFGSINMARLQEGISLDKFWKAFMTNCEALPREILPAASVAAGRRIHGTFVIVDLKGFGIGQFWSMKDYVRSTFQVSQDYFPETMAQLAIVNAPSSFTTIWSMIKPWLAKETVKKVSIHGSDFKEHLLELMDIENLPASLGGNCTCAEHGGCMMSNAGPWQDDRAQRRKAWLAGERETIALTQADVDAREAQREESPEATESQPSTVTSGASSVNGSTGSPRSLVPQPDAADAVSIVGSSENERDAEGGVRKLTKEESVQEVYEKHPETREVQNGDLHKEVSALVR